MADQQASTGGFSTFVAELRRRKVIRVAAVYAAVAWAVLQVCDVLLEPLQLPTWSLNLVLLLFAAGFPIACVLAWAFETTPGGVQRTPALASAEQQALHKSRYLDFIVIAILSLAVGYLYLGHFVDDDEAETDTVGAVPNESQRLSIAVLPFADMSAGADQGHFGDGIAEEILNVLTRVQGIKVIARTSSFQFKGKDTDIPGIAATLGATHLLEGSVRTDGDRIRVTAQLIDAADNAHVWSETYDRQLVSIFDIQDEIATAIGARLRISLADSTKDGRATESLEALNAFLRGRHHYNRYELNDALAGYEEAVRLDPRYIDAWNGLLNVHWRLYQNAPSSERRVQYDHAVEQVLGLDPQHKYALSLLAHRDAFRDFNWQDAIDASRRLVVSHPNDVELIEAYNDLLEATSQAQVSLDLTDHWLAVDPLNPEAYISRGIALLGLGDPDAASAQFSRARELGGRNVALLGEAILALWREDAEGLEAAIREAETIPEMAGRALFWKLNLAIATGDDERARALVTDDHPWAQALLDGDLERVFELEHEVLHDWRVRRSSWRAFQSRGQRAWRHHRFLPEFQDVLRTANLDDASVAKLEVPLLNLPGS